MMIISVIFSALAFPFIGKIIDDYPAIRIVPWAFTVRCASTYMFNMLKRPDSTSAYVVCVVMIIATIFESNLVDSIFTKNLNKETRGILCGLQMFVCNFGILFYSLASGWLFDNVGASAPFILIGVVDFLFAILVILKTYQYDWW